MKKTIGAVVIILLCVLVLGTIIFISKQKFDTVSYNTSHVTLESSFFQPQLLTINDIFNNDHSFIATLSAKHITTMIATGDIIPARSVNFQTLQAHDFTWAFQKTAADLRNADITFINLESPLIPNCPVTNEGMIFCGDQKHVQGLTFAGINVASLANNHAGNHDVIGVKQTVQLLNDNGITVTGVNGPAYKKVKNITFAFLGYNDVTTPQPGVENADFETIKRKIKEARSHADVVIVTYHWGVEYRLQPDDRQKQLGHFTIDNGADLVIGNHPHWIQPIEIYKGKLITYAHGNFVFDQMWSQKTREGVVGKYTFYDNQLIDVEYFPVLIENYGQPHFVEGVDKKRILDDMKNQSIILSKNSPS